MSGCNDQLGMRLLVPHKDIEWHLSWEVYWHLTLEYFRRPGRARGRPPRRRRGAYRWESRPRPRLPAPRHRPLSHPLPSATTPRGGGRPCQLQDCLLSLHSLMPLCRTPRLGYPSASLLADGLTGSADGVVSLEGWWAAGIVAFALQRCLGPKFECCWTNAKSNRHLLPNRLPRWRATAMARDLLTNRLYNQTSPLTPPSHGRHEVKVFLQLPYHVKKCPSDGKPWCDA